MRIKTIFLLILTILLTIVLMKNTESVNFWIFGDHSVSKLAILAIFFLLGIIVGLILARSGKKKDQHPSVYSITGDAGETLPPATKSLSAEDEEDLRND